MVLFSIVTVTMALTLLLVAPFSGRLQTLLVANFTREIPVGILLLPGLCMTVWLFKPAMIFLSLCGFLFTVTAGVFFFRMTAHLTVWGASGLVYESLVFGTIYFLACGVFTLTQSWHIAHQTANYRQAEDEMSDGFGDMSGANA